MTLVKLCSKPRIDFLGFDETNSAHSYALSELQKDIDKELDAVTPAEREALRTKFAIFVVHNKLKPKLATLPSDVP